MEKNNTTYFQDGKEYIRLTSVIPKNFDMVHPLVMEKACELGDNVHLACHLHDTRQLAMASVDAVVMKYLQAWIKFLSSYNLTVLYSEKTIVSDRYGVGTTFDRVLVDSHMRNILAEIKTVSAMSEDVGTQLGGQELIINDVMPLLNIHKKWGVQLKPDGTFRVYPYDDIKYRILYKKLLKEYKENMK